MLRKHPKMKTQHMEVQDLEFALLGFGLVWFWYFLIVFPFLAFKNENVYPVPSCVGNI